MAFRAHLQRRWNRSGFVERSASIKTVVPEKGLEAELASELGRRWPVTGARTVCGGVSKMFFPVWLRPELFRHCSAIIESSELIQPLIERLLLLVIPAKLPTIAALDASMARTWTVISPRNIIKVSRAHISSDVRCLTKSSGRRSRRRLVLLFRRTCVQRQSWVARL